MITNLIANTSTLQIALAGAFVSFAISLVVLMLFAFILPVDHGRAFAVDGAKSKGKPTGAGILFITVFVLSSILFIPMRLEFILYYIFIGAAMIAGYLDDGAKKPWNEYLKGLLDLAISFMTALTFSYFSSREIFFPMAETSITIPFAVYLILGTILVWVSINVTNCTDGVDGLSSSLAIVSIASMILFSYLIETDNTWTGTRFIMIGVLIAYLWLNTHPSRILMGDAGSRALGVFLAISIMQTRQPIVFLIFCAIFMIDGSAGILKISLKRFLHICILKKTITPFHDHFRKNLGWSNPQIVARAVILQLIVSSVYLYLVFVMKN